MDMNKYDKFWKCFLCVLKYLVISIHDNLEKNQPIIQMQYLINSIYYSISNCGII